LGASIPAQLGGLCVTVLAMRNKDQAKRSPNFWVI
jgi:hypothetical protein